WRNRILLCSEEPRRCDSDLMGTVFAQIDAPLLQTAAIHSLRIVRSFQRKRSDGSNQDGSGNTVSVVARQISHDFSGAHRVAHEGDATKIKLLDDGSKIVGERVKIIAISGLLRAS